MLCSSRSFIYLIGLCQGRANVHFPNFASIINQNWFYISLNIKLLAPGGSSSSYSRPLSAASELMCFKKRGTLINTHFFPLLLHTQSALTSHSLFLLCLEGEKKGRKNTGFYLQQGGEEGSLLC